METKVRLIIKGNADFVSKKFWQLHRIMHADRLIKGWLLTEISTLTEKRQEKPIYSIKTNNPIAFAQGNIISQFEVTFIKTQ